MIATGLLAAAGLVSPSIADTRPTYDKRIEEAAISRLVPKLGEMRGSLELGVNTHLPPQAPGHDSGNEAADSPAPSPRGRGNGSFLYF